MVSIDPASVLPHRAPFLFLDRIEEVEGGQGGRGSRLVTAAEYWVRGGDHLPRVLVIESLAQLAAAANAIGDDGEPTGPAPLGYLAGIDGFEWQGDVGPGDRVELVVRVERRFGRTTRCRALARVEGHRVAEGVLTFVTETGDG